MLISLFILGCGKDDGSITDPGNGDATLTDGISADAFERYEGSLGVVFDAREVVKKGYQPTQAQVNIDASEGSYSQLVELDEALFMGQVDIPIEGLSEAAKAELMAGVPVTVELLDANGQNIMVSDFGILNFQDNPPIQTVNAVALSNLNTVIELNEETPYYIQRLDADGKPTSQAFTIRSNASNVATSSTIPFDKTEIHSLFNFVAIPNLENVFAIKLIETGQYLAYTSEAHDSEYGTAYNQAPFMTQYDSYSEIEALSNFSDFHFQFELDEAYSDEGGNAYVLSHYNGAEILVAPGIGLTGLDDFTFNSGTTVTSQTIRWRIIAANINWEVNSIGTTFMTPILPPAETSFGFNSTLTNCGNGDLMQTVGVTKNETSSRTFTMQEAITIASSSETNGSATVGMEVEAGFFGNSATYNASATLGFSYTSSFSSTSTNTHSHVSEVSDEISTERTVNVPSGSASLVYDVYQFYPNSVVHFCQELRIKGTDSNTGEPLSGKEIQSQFQFNNFNGVIVAVEGTSVVVSLRGTAVLEKMIKTTSKVEAVEPDC